MAKNFWAVVNKVIAQADVLLEIIDARAIEETRNRQIETKVKNAGKVLVYVLNKCDLADKAELEKVKKTLVPSVFISCKDYSGINLLRERILIEGKRVGLLKPKVGVLGYPNMGKSSVINALTGTGKARASSEAGFTKGKQHISARNFLLIDTPGVIPSGEKDIVKDVMTGITTKLKDPESALLSVMEQYPGMVEKHYDVPVEEDKEETLEKIAVKMRWVRKGNVPDTEQAAKKILKLIREGKIAY